MKKGFDTQFTGIDNLITSYINEGGICMVMIGHNLVLFGGLIEKRQISIVYPTGVYRLLTLDFDFADGRCYHKDGEVYLCFSNDLMDSCMKRYCISSK